MSGDLILLTGSTGFLGFRALRYALEYGYQVRAAVRSEAKAELVRSNPALKAMGKDNQLTFVIIPDFLRPGAFDEAIKGAKYVLHVASPVPSGLGPGTPGENYNESFVKPAVRATIAVLEAARKTQTVDRVVITSSITAVTSPNIFVESNTELTYTPESRTSQQPPPFDNPFMAYTASKVAALNAAEEWMTNEKPNFDVIHIVPAFVLGRDDLAFTIAGVNAGANALVIGQALGKKDIEAVPNTTVHIDDAARLHVLALDPKVKGNRNVLATSSGQDGMTWKDVNAIIDKRFPDAVRDGILPNTFTYNTNVCQFDITETEKTFGKLKGLEEQVVSLIGQYLEVLKNDK